MKMKYLSLAVFIILFFFQLVAEANVLKVKPGLEILLSKKDKLLIGKRIGLVTNQTAVTHDKKHIFDLLTNNSRFKLTALFSPEHGIRGLEDDKVSSGKDKKTHLPIYSLYGKHHKPTAEMLKNVDVILFDMQDVGVRYYTYISTLALVMQAAKENNKIIIVLDRPNMLGGKNIEGPLPDKRLWHKFTSYYPIPTRYGMTIGELARLYNDFFKINCNLIVIPMEGWNRSMYFDETGLPWINPSPSLNNIESVIHYSGLGSLEATNISVGRGTDFPFLRYGAPWMNAKRVAAKLNARHLPGIYFKAVKFKPKSIKGRPTYPYTGKLCQGFEPIITDRNKYKPVLTVMHIMDVIGKLYPKKFSMADAMNMIGKKSLLEQIRQGESPERIATSWDVSQFLKAREKALLY